MKRKYNPPLAQTARDLGISRQRVWALKRVAEGKCKQCGKEREGHYSDKCNACEKKRRDAAHRRHGVERQRGPYRPRSTT